MIKPSLNQRFELRLLQVGIALLLLLLAGGLSLLLSACDGLQATTYVVKDWKDAQSTLDKAVSGDTMDFSALGTPDTTYTLNVPANLSLTLIGNPEVDFIGVSLDFAGSNTVTIQDLHITAADNQAPAALQFTGKGNQLLIAGDNSVRNAPAPAETGFGAAIGVAEGVTLVINGSGSLTAIGGSSAAGIGGGAGSNSGNITINSGTITAQGGELGNATGGAGIGGGSNGVAATIIIRGGTINATAGDGAAGIGSGASAAGGNLEIAGGTISAVGTVGIGGGAGGADANVTFSSGSLTAQGAGNNAGDAINGVFVKLPDAYQWWAGATPDQLAVSGQNYPGASFVDRGYAYIRIVTV
ncbi:MAG: hypothetical protein FWC59_00230 [Actinomycetia bacterium]|nr:hypothetical protein [Actinomycetes bacterium]